MDDGEPDTEVHPYSPGGGAGAGPVCAEAVLLGPLISAEVILRFSFGGTGKSCQECLRGNFKLKKARRAVLVIFHRREAASARTL